MKKNLLGFAAFTLMLTSCQKSEIVERVDDGDNQFLFGVYQGKVTKASELTNSALHSDGTEFPLYVYKGEQGGEKSKYFQETLTYSDAERKWSTSIPRFLTDDVPLQLYAYYPHTAGATNYSYANFATADTYPTLEYTIQDKQEDLVAASINNNTGNEITIPFKHILSQINFGVKGYYGAKITISNIVVKQVSSKGTYSFNPGATTSWTPVGTPKDYEYKFGTGADAANSSYTTRGGVETGGKWDDTAEGESDNTYILGDGGTWSVGKGTNATNLWYVAANGNPVQGTNIDDNTAKRDNALMLMPQSLVAGVTAAYVTFDYKIQDLEGAYIVGDQNSSTQGQFDLNIKDATNTEYADVWKPNLRYLYIIDFKGYLDGKKLSFEVDVETNPWENYNPENGNDGIVLLSSLDGTVFNNNIKKLGNTAPNNTFSIPLGHLFTDITWNWASYVMDNSFTTTQSFNITFTNVKFNGRQLTVVPPFGFTVSTNETPTPNPAGKVSKTTTTLTFTPLTNAYYVTGAEISAAMTADQDYTFNASNKVKLSEVVNARATAGKKITLNFATSYATETLPTGWAFEATSGKKTVVFTKK